MSSEVYLCHTSDMSPPPYLRLRNLIVRGTLAPGQAVSEATLATRLGVSRTPIRQAMHRLTAEGLLVVTGGGARPRMAVAPLDRDEARECYVAVGLLESSAARSVAGWPAATRRALADELRALDAAFRAAADAKRPAPDVLYERHFAFHDRLRRATAGPVVRDLLAAVAPRLERYQFFHAPLLQGAGIGFERTYAEHQAIVRAVRAGTADAVERCVRANWERAADRLTSAIRAGDGAR